MLIPQQPYFTSSAHRALSYAHDLADRLGHDDITSTHVMLGVIENGRNPGVAALYSLGVDLAELQAELEADLPPRGVHRDPPSDREWTPTDQNYLQIAKTEAERHGTIFIGCEHLLAGIVADSSCAMARALKRRLINRGRLAAAIRSLYRTPD